MVDPRNDGLHDASLAEAGREASVARDVLSEIVRFVFVAAAGAGTYAGLRFGVELNNGFSVTGTVLVAAVLFYFLLWRPPRN